VAQLFKNCFQEIVLNGADAKATLQAQGKQLNAILADLKVPCWAPDPVQAGQVCKAA
jgi:multiple sugar transport system substrate-binding protein